MADRRGRPAATRAREDESGTEQSERCDSLHDDHYRNVG